MNVCIREALYFFLAFLNDYFQFCFNFGQIIYSYLRITSKYSVTNVDMLQLSRFMQFPDKLSDLWAW